MVSIRKVAALCIATLWLASPASSFASGDWAWPVEGAVVTPYGARYTSDQGTARTHGGVDIGCPAGAKVRSCVAGEVVFSGQVPAGEGERAWAVTVLTADGLRVTYLPLERSSVSKGTAVAEGSPLGEVAAAGDASSAASHLHLGVRRGEARLDPLSLLCAAGSPAASGAKPAVTPPATPAPRADPAPVVPRPAPSTASAPVGMATPVPAGQAAAVPAAPTLLPHTSMPELPVLTRVPMLDTAPRVRTAAVAAGVEATRAFLATLLTRLALVGVAAACAWPVLRSVLEGRTQQSLATAAAPRDGA